MDRNYVLQLYNYHYRYYVYEALRRRRIAVAAYLLLRERRDRNRKRLWVREWIRRRNEGEGVLNMVHNELRLQDAASFKNYLRMDEEVFNELLARLTPLIYKQDTVMRAAISPRQRLAATLRFLASGNTYKDLSYSVRIAQNTLSGIIPTTLRAIINVLEDECITCPNSPGEWKEVENGYRLLWNFPHCIGAMDGKHINFRPPRRMGSYYRNYKGRDSIVLFALVDASYKFLYVDVGKNGRCNDSHVFRESELGQHFFSKTLNFPESCALPGYNPSVQLPYVWTGDDAFPLSEHLLKPFPSRGLTYEQRVFNYRLSRARRVVENAFGILANRFRILLTTINLPVSTVELITRACCILHNFILARKPALLRNVGGEDDTCDEDMHCSLSSVVHQGGNNPTRTAKAVREHFMQYFTSVGAVPWQHDAVLRGNY